MAVPQNQPEDAPKSGPFTRRNTGRVMVSRFPQLLRGAVTVRNPVLIV